MKIPFATRSSYTGPCENAIRFQADDLSRGLPVNVSLEPGGYAGKVEVNIIDNEPVSFGTDWVGTDPTRFPTRIKAAATALYRCSCFGEYVISHNDGRLTIKRIKSVGR